MWLERNSWVNEKCWKNGKCCLEWSEVDTKKIFYLFSFSDNDYYSVIANSNVAHHYVHSSIKHIIRIDRPPLIFLHKEFSFRSEKLFISSRFSFYWTLCVRSWFFPLFISFEKLWSFEQWEILIGKCIMYQFCLQAFY